MKNIPTIVFKALGNVLLVCAFLLIPTGIAIAVVLLADKVELGETTRIILGGIYHAAGRLFAILIACGVYMGGKVISEQYKSKLKSYLAVFGIAALLAFFSYSDFGTHVEDEDPVFGGGQVVVDFSPTDAERLKHGVSTFVLLAVLLSMGASSGLREKSEVDELVEMAESNRSSGKRTSDDTLRI